MKGALLCVWLKVWEESSMTVIKHQFCQHFLRGRNFLEKISSRECTLLCLLQYTFPRSNWSCCLACKSLQHELFIASIISRCLCIMLLSSSLSSFSLSKRITQGFSVPFLDSFSIFWLDFFTAFTDVLIPLRDERLETRDRLQDVTTRVTHTETLEFSCCFLPDIGCYHWERK